MTPEPAKFVSAPDASDRAEPPPAVLAPPLEDAGPLVPVPVDMRNAAITVMAVIAGVLVLQYGQPVFVPLVLGVLLSYALDPAVSWLTRHRVPRGVGAAVILLVLLGAGAAAAVQLRYQVQAIVQQLPDGARRLRRIMESQRNGSPTALDQVQQAATELERAADATGTAPPTRPGVTRVQVEEPPIRVSDYVTWGAMGMVAAAGQAIVVLFLVYFLLASGDLYRRKLVKIVGPSLTKKKVTVQILQEIDQQIESFMVLQVFTSALVGTATWLAFWWLGLEQAAVWGLLAGVFNSIPYIGPVVVSAGTAIVAFLQFGTLEMTLLTSSVALVITSLEGFLLTPWLSSRAARMNAVAVFVGLLFWGWVWNVWGMLLAVPMLMVIKSVCDHVEDFKGVGELLGD